MEDKLLECVNYIKNISKQKVTSGRIFLYMKKNDESVGGEEIQKTITTFVSLNCLEEQELVLNHTLFSLFLTISWLCEPRFWTRLNKTSHKWIFQSLMRQIPQLATHRKMKIGMLCWRIWKVLEFRDSVESRLHRMEEAIIGNNTAQKAFLPTDNSTKASSGFVSDLLKRRIVFLEKELKQKDTAVKFLTKKFVDDNC